ncbi:MAG: ethanolamine utilization protein EutH [Firmicutes bacterium]|nr:ethanolamine utilization protein EutH [Bacillota bacterium]
MTLSLPGRGFITRKFSAPLTRLGQRFDLDETSMVGLISNLPNNILVFQLMKDINPKGKILNCAFTVSASFVLGDHLGFAADMLCRDSLCHQGFRILEFQQDSFVRFVFRFQHKAMVEAGT